MWQLKIKRNTFRREKKQTKPTWSARSSERPIITLHLHPAERRFIKWAEHISLPPITNHKIMMKAENISMKPIVAF